MKVLIDKTVDIPVEELVMSMGISQFIFDAVTSEDTTLQCLEIPYTEEPPDAILFLRDISEKNIIVPDLPSCVVFFGKFSEEDLLLAKKLRKETKKLKK